MYNIILIQPALHYGKINSFSRFTSFLRQFRKMQRFNSVLRVHRATPFMQAYSSAPMAIRNDHVELRDNA